MSRPVRCLGLGCERLARVRGLCRPCYARLYKAVAEGKVTGGWAEATAAGLCLPGSGDGKTPGANHPWRRFARRKVT